MTAPEFSRPVRIDTIGDTPHVLEVVANEAERAALARRFDLVAIDRLTAALSLTRTGAEIALAGTLSAGVTQACAATGVPLAAKIETPFALVFRPDPQGLAEAEEVELAPDELDIVFYDGSAIDAGEAVAETLLLNLDPYPRAPDAAERLRQAGVKDESEAGPFAALAGLRDQLKGEAP